MNSIYLDCDELNNDFFMAWVRSDIYSYAVNQDDDYSMYLMGGEL